MLHSEGGNTTPAFCIQHLDVVLDNIQGEFPESLRVLALDGVTLIRII